MSRPLECSLWYCAACSEGGELLCCDGCPAAYHMACLGSSQAQPMQNSEWLCGQCRKVGAHRLCGLGPLGLWLGGKDGGKRLVKRVTGVRLAGALGKDTVLPF